MTLHLPKHISSVEGLGVNTTKTMTKITDTVSIGREVWNDMKEPWREGSTIIAEPGYTWVTKWEVGAPYIVTKFQDTNGQLVGAYCDVSRPIDAVDGGFSFIDLYLDVWQSVGEDPVILDEDELVEAVGAGYVTANEAGRARKIAAGIVTSLRNDPTFIDF